MIKDSYLKLLLLNVNIIKFVLTHIKNDLDKLTVKEITHFRRVMCEWKWFECKDIILSDFILDIPAFTQFNGNK